MVSEVQPTHKTKLGN